MLIEVQRSAELSACLAASSVPIPGDRARRRGVDNETRGFELDVQLLESLVALSSRSPSPRQGILQ
jgi:hypothetical protein